MPNVEVVAPWIYTYTGQKVDLFNPDPDTIKVTDIAHALSQIGRWGGHSMFFWSVAQHSVLVSKYCAPEDAMIGLFHDAAEAYLGDICRPLKRTRGMTEYREVYRNMEQIILNKFCNVSELPPSVKRADEIILATEAKFLMQRSDMNFEDDEWLCDEDPVDMEITPATSEYARQGFLIRYYRIGAMTGKRAP